MRNTQRGSLARPESPPAMKRRWIVTAVVGLLLPVLYVLSEAPLHRIVGGVHPGKWQAYALFDRLTEWKPLLTLLADWANLWGVEANYMVARHHRSGGEYELDGQSWIIRR